MRNHWRTLIIVLATLAQPWSARAATPREDLLGLVPSEPAICVAVQDLRGQYRQVLDSPFGKRLADSPFLAAILDAEPFSKLRELDTQLQTHLQTSLATLRDDAFGDAFVFAFWPADGAGTESALVITRARDKELPANVLKRLNDLQLQSGELVRVESVAHGQATYLRCTEAAGKVNYQWVQDGLVALTSNETLLKQVIDRSALDPAKRDAPLAKAFVELGVDKDAAVFWINPRAFDGQMADKLGQAAEPEASFLRGLQGYWQKTTGLAISAHVGDTIDLRLVVRMPTEGLSPAAQQFLKEAQRPSALWKYVPEDAIIAAAARFDLAEFLNVASEFLPAELRAKHLEEANRATLALLGMDVQKDILGRLGPDWGFYVSAPPTPRVIPDVVLAMALRQPDAETEEAFGDALRTLGGVLAMQRTNEGKPTVLKRTRDGNVRITSLWSEHGFGEGLQPAGAIKDRCLVLASSPDALGRFSAGKAPAVAKNGSVPLLKVSFTRALAFLNDPERRPALIAALSQMHGQAAAGVDERLQKLASFLELFDSLSMDQEVAPGRLTLHARIKTKEALKTSTAAR